MEGGNKETTSAKLDAINRQLDAMSSEVNQAIKTTEENRTMAAKLEPKILILEAVVKRYMDIFEEKELDKRCQFETYNEWQAVHQRYYDVLGNWNQELGPREHGVAIVKAGEVYIEEQLELVRRLEERIQQLRPY